jgi:hypothetical protein
MNAHKLRVEMHNGILTIPVPEDMKNNRFFDVFIAADETPVKDKRKIDFRTLAGKFKHLDTKKVQELDNMRNEWERDI